MKRPSWMTETPCVCLPELGYVCKLCQQKADRDHTTSQPDPPEYEGYALADQDGYDGGRATPQQEKEEEMIQAASELFDAGLQD